MKLPFNLAENAYFVRTIGDKLANGAYRKYAIVEYEMIETIRMNDYEGLSFSYNGTDREYVFKTYEEAVEKLRELWGITSSTSHTGKKKGQYE